ncbi:cryptochrome/photolyase family protein [Synechococcus sp. A10-1-5-1]|uniref:cryptochrome/photolyase family protein n=1 Tax=Synechococcus sp. A10-1-5-1 TaxID=2936507 RepID=UPI0020006C0F|nr:cryptochrome/photolyase family protein [Synechococcus sp. A10-1-5-1]UPM50531.1 cryptochrome/photolyase family protein [Synechococcus sp. A10-1-5-1]
MTIGIWVLGDQLNLEQAALASSRPERSRVLLLESCSVLERRAYHAQKMVLVWSAMRHFAGDLRDQGWTVDCLETEQFSTGLLAWIERHGIEELRLMEPVDRGFRNAIERLSLPIPLQWIPSNAFLWSRDDFADWAARYKQLRMELFYREGRKRFGVLMDDDAEPMGGQWNYDQDNRKPPTKGLSGPAPLWFEPDAITEAVIEKVEGLRERFALPGRAHPFRWAVSRKQALEVLEHFIATRLSGFGPYQDAMVSGEPTLWHALLSPYLNLGLLHPLEVIQRLEAEGLARQVPLAGLEGVIRQVLGWREYTHGLYHWFGEDYAVVNHFKATAPLPHWFEELGGSGMRCLDTVLGEIKTSAYAHHIQRLMLLANYGLLAGLDPQALTAWFHRMFIDGFDWVMLTNVLGMGVFADGGRLASKPYAASGNYIKRMSNYCKGCAFDVKQRTGPQACPFNSLYWDFLARHEPELKRNHRMGLVMKQLSKLPEEEIAAIRSSAANHRAMAASGAT